MAKEHTKGAISRIRGTLEEWAGRVTGNRKQQGTGSVRQVQGKAQQGLGDVQDAVGKAETRP
jgi:uncharacterized protein YjbJ (UPF0337 family)